MIIFTNKFINFSIIILIVSCSYPPPQDYETVRKDHDTTNDKIIGLSKEDIIILYGVPYTVVKLHNQEYWGYRRYGSCIVTVVFDKNEKLVKRYKNVFCL
jgi:hypothetical protein